MLSVTMIMRAHPGCADALGALWAEIGRDVRAVEPGCLHFVVSRDVDDPERFTVFELYADQAAFDLHHDNHERAAVLGPKLASLRQAPVQRVVGAIIG